MMNRNPFASQVPAIDRRRALILGGTLLAAPFWCKPSRAQDADEKPVSLSAIARQAPRALPDLTFSDDAGAAHPLSQWRGRGVVVHVWATWCPPCVLELPKLAALSARLGPQDPALVIVSADHGGATAVHGFMSRHHITPFQGYLDPKASVMSALGVEELPFTFVVDAKGQEVARHGGPIDWAAPDAIAQLRRLTA